MAFTRMPSPYFRAISLASHCVKSVSYTHLAKDTLATWKAPAGVALNSDFTVKVRLQDGVWHTLSSYLIKVDEVRDTRHYVENASMAIFDFTGKVEVAVTYNLGEVQTAKVRPLSYDIPFQIDGNTVTFTLEPVSYTHLDVYKRQLDTFLGVDDMRFAYQAADGIRRTILGT